MIRTTLFNPVCCGSDFLRCYSAWIRRVSCYSMLNVVSMCLVIYFVTHKLTDVFLLMLLSHYEPSKCTILHICGRCGAYNVALLLTPIARKMSSILAFPIQMYSPASSIYIPRYTLTNIPRRYMSPEDTLQTSATSTSVVRIYHCFFPPMHRSPSPTNFR